MEHVAEVIGAGRHHSNKVGFALPANVHVPAPRYARLSKDLLSTNQKDRSKYTIGLSHLTFQSQGDSVLVVW